jgi:PAS domain S-box-containing protein
MAILSTDYRVTDWNPAATAITGYEAEEAKGQTLAWIRAQCVPREGREEPAADRLPSEGSFAEWRRRSDGRRYWCEGTRFRLIDARGRIRGYAKCFRDASQTKRIEDELRNSRQHLKEVEHLIQIGSWEWDLASNHVTWSDALFDIYGMERAEFDPRYSLIAEHVHPEDRERVDGTLAGALQTGNAIDISYRIVRPDGRIRHVHALAEFIFDATGTPQRLAGVAQDITDLPRDGLARGQLALTQPADERAQREPAPAGSVERLLTPRQLEILRLIADGYRNGEIAARLYLTEGTVKWHVRQILHVLGVANRAEAAAHLIASQRG